MNRSIAGWSGAMISALSVMLFAGTATAARIEIAKPGADHDRSRDEERLMTYRTPEGQERPVRTAEDWAMRRQQIITGVEKVMGELPDRSRLPPLDVKIMDRVERDGYVRLSITYVAEEGDRVPAYLLLPKDRPGAAACPRSWPCTERRSTARSWSAVKPLLRGAPMRRSRPGPRACSPPATRFIRITSMPKSWPSGAMLCCARLSIVWRLSLRLPQEQVRIGEHEGDFQPHAGRGFATDTRGGRSPADRRRSAIPWAGTTPCFWACSTSGLR